MTLGVSMMKGSSMQVAQYLLLADVTCPPGPRFAVPRIEHLTVGSMA